MKFSFYIESNDELIFDSRVTVDSSSINRSSIIGIGNSLLYSLMSLMRTGDIDKYACIGVLVDGKYYYFSPNFPSSFLEYLESSMGKYESKNTYIVFLSYVCSCVDNLLIEVKNHM